MVRPCLLQQVLPLSVRAVEAFADVDAPLHPEEEAGITGAVTARRREHTTVRLCARLALARLGVAPVPLVRGRLGAPQWPDGVIGSMTHCAGYRAAAVTRAGGLRVLGIDAEPDAPLPDGVLPGISLPGELARLRALAADDNAVHWDRLLFSAKESVYKAWFPLAERILDFTDAEVLIGGAGTFEARLLVPEPLADGARVSGFAGRWLARAGLLITAVAEVHLAGAGGSPISAAGQAAPALGYATHPGA